MCVNDENNDDNDDDNDSNKDVIPIPKPLMFRFSSKQIAVNYF